MKWVKSSSPNCGEDLTHIKALKTDQTVGLWGGKFPKSYPCRPSKKIDCFFFEG